MHYLHYKQPKLQQDKYDGKIVPAWKMSFPNAVHDLHKLHVNANRQKKTHGKTENKKIVFLPSLLSSLLHSSRQSTLLVFWSGVQSWMITKPADSLMQMQTGFIPQWRWFRRWSRCSLIPSCINTLIFYSRCLRFKAQCEIWIFSYPIWQMEKCFTPTCRPIYRVVILAPDPGTVSSSELRFLSFIHIQLSSLL